MIYKLCKTLSAALAVTAIAGCAALYQDRPETVSAKYNLTNGNDWKATLVNSKLRVTTSAGDVRLWLSDIESIEPRARKKGHKITTTHGDVWTVEDVKGETFYSYSEEQADLFKSYYNSVLLKSINTRRWRQLGHSLIVLNNGDRVFADASELNFSVTNKSGKWVLPAGALKAARVRKTEGTVTNISLLAVFPSGHVEEYNIAESDRDFSARDTFGNSLEFKYNDVSHIIGMIRKKGKKTDVRKDQLPREDLIQKAQKAKVIYEPSQYRQIEYEPFSIEIKTDQGKLLLPSSVIRQIVCNPSLGKPYISTVYGEKFYGSFNLTGIKPYLPKTKSLSTSPVRKPDMVSFNNPVATRPPSWCLVKTTGGNLFYAKFADDKLEFQNAEEQEKTEKLPIETIYGIKNRKETGELRVFTGAGNTLDLQPASHRIVLVLLINGRRLSVPWSNIDSVSAFYATAQTRKDTNPETLRRLDSFPETRAYNIASANVEGKVDIKTAIGEVSLPYAILKRIHKNKDSDLACFITTTGDHFVTSRLQEKQIRAIMSFPADGLHNPDGMSEKKNNSSFAEPDSAAMAWRLKSGDMFYAQPNENDLEFSLTESRALQLIQTDKILKIKPDKDGDLRIDTSTGSFIGSPKTASLNIELTCNTQKVSVSFNELEVAQRGNLNDLPPPVHVVPGATPFQEGVVLIEKGWFMIGTKSGEHGMPDETPWQKVYVPSFYMDSCEITKDQFQLFVKETDYETEAEKQNSRRTWKDPGFAQQGAEPVVCVSWFDAIHFCNWRSRKAELEQCYEINDEEVVCNRNKSGYRLPTEAEWEYAARSGGKDIVFPWSKPGKDSQSQEAPASKANYATPEPGAGDNWLWTNPVKAFNPSEIGLYGMGGNVWEWCNDAYFDRAYYAVHKRNPRDPCVDVEHISGRTQRVMRGGSFKNKLDMLRCSSRAHGFPHASANRVGFRCVRRVAHHGITSKHD